MIQDLIKHYAVKLAKFLLLIFDMMLTLVFVSVAGALLVLPPILGIMYKSPECVLLYMTAIVIFVLIVAKRRHP
jgi:hypothetical protein